MKLTCDTAVQGGPGQTSIPPCGKPAVLVILTEERFFEARGRQPEGYTSRLLAHPVCADHAPEEVHEAQTSMAPDEFLVVNLPEPPQKKWRVENNISGFPASREYYTEADADAACYALNLDDGPGGRYGVYVNDGTGVDWKRATS